MVRSQQEQAEARTLTSFGLIQQQAVNLFALLCDALGELANLTGEGFDFSFHAAYCGGKVVAFLGELIGAGLSLFTGSAFLVQQSVQALQRADIGAVHGSVGRVLRKEPAKKSVCICRR